MVEWPTHTNTHTHISVNECRWIKLIRGECDGHVTAMPSWPIITHEFSAIWFSKRKTTKIDFSARATGITVANGLAVFTIFTYALDSRHPSPADGSIFSFKIEHELRATNDLLPLSHWHLRRRRRRRPQWRTPMTQNKHAAVNVSVWVCECGSGWARAR